MPLPGSNSSVGVGYSFHPEHAVLALLNLGEHEALDSYVRDRSYS